MTREAIGRVIRAADMSARSRAMWADRVRKRRRLGGLAVARLWHQPDPGRTSQRRVVGQHMHAGKRYRFTLGGNRSGKSEGGAQEDVVWALGRNHPASQAWARANRIDLEAAGVPEGPSPVCVVALTSDASLKYVRPAVNRYLPPGSKWRNRLGRGAAWVTLPNGGMIWFSSVDQGEDAFQGDKYKRVRFDEEPGNRLVVDEAKMRLVDLAGHMAFTMTPLKGWTWLLREYVRPVERSGDEGDVSVHYLHGEDNPHLPEGELQELLEGATDAVRRARLYGEIVALKGLVHSPWRRDLHIVPTREIPKEWPRYTATDFGIRNPTAVVWAALGPDDVLEVYRLLYRAEQPQEVHAETFKAASGWEHDKQLAQLGQVPNEKRGQGMYGNRAEEPEEFRACLADPEDAGARSTWRNHGVRTIKAWKEQGSIRHGIDAINARLVPDAEGRPHIVFQAHLVPLIEEIEGLVWADEGSRGDNPPDVPAPGCPNHAWDGVRYICSRIERRGEGGRRSEAKPNEPEEREDEPEEAGRWGARGRLGRRIRPRRCNPPGSNSGDPPYGGAWVGSPGTELEFAL